jgi:signal transduction histidine kinase
VHFDGVGSEDSSASDLRKFTTDELLGREELGDREELNGREDEGHPHAPREGLPSRFRMRHSRHYVDELLGDKPLRTVREIPIAEIELPTDEEDLDALEDFEESIRRLGVLEPLLVGKGGSQYRVIAGMRRLRAARKLGLNTVPCLVHDVDDERMKNMREAAMQRLSAAPSPPPSEPSEPAVTPAPAAGERTGLSDATQGLEFISALLPAMNAAGSDRLRWAVLTDLAGVELSRARTAALAGDILARTEPLERTLVDFSSLLSDIVASVSTEARLRNVRLDVTARDTESGISLDAALCRNALTGLVQCLLAFAGRAGTTLEIQAQMTSVRPALIVQCVLRDADVELSGEAVKRFFEADWREHPSGISGARVLAAAAKTARAHGGRIELLARPPRGCTVTFVVPRPLADL